MRNVLALSWGVQSFEVAEVASTDAMVEQVDQTLRANGLAELGDYVVVVSGAPVGVAGTTNSILVHKIGEDGAAGSRHGCRRARPARRTRTKGPGMIPGPCRRARPARGG